jgi:hypothetical protein
VSSHIWGAWPDSYYSLTVTVLFLWGAFSKERTGLSFAYAAGPRQGSLSWVRVPWDSWPYWTSSSQSQNYVTTDRQSASLYGVKHQSEAYDQIFVAVRQVRVCWCGALSLTREWVCRIQLLLVLASAVILGSESRGTREHIVYCLRFEISPTWRARSTYLYSLGTGGPVTSPGILVMWDPRYITSGRPHRKHRLLCCCVLMHCCRNVFTALLRSNERDAGPQRRPLTTFLLLLHDVIAYVMHSSAACVQAIT